MQLLEMAIRHFPIPVVVRIIRRISMLIIQSMTLSIWMSFIAKEMLLKPKQIKDGKENMRGVLL